MKKIKPKMNENQKIEFVLSYCENLARDRSSEQDYLVFKKELMNSLKATKSIRIYDLYKSGVQGIKECHKTKKFHGHDTGETYRSVKLSKATLSQLKNFADREVVKFLA